MLDRSSSYRSSVGRSVGAIPSYNGKKKTTFKIQDLNVVSTY